MKSYYGDDVSGFHGAVEGTPKVALESLLDYEQPTKYLVSSTTYSDHYDTPVLTAGKTFILGYTNEKHGICHASPENPVIIFDDFTTAFKWVDFPFKAKSSAMKLLRPKSKQATDLRFVYHSMSKIAYTPAEHSRQWISRYSRLEIDYPREEVRREIVTALNRFETLQENLESELRLRTNQYEYFRGVEFDRIASSADVRWAKLGDVSDCYPGATPRSSVPRFWNAGTIPWMSSGEVNKRTIYATDKYITEEAFDSCSTKMVPPNSVVLALAGQGKTRGSVARTRLRLCTNQSLCAIVPSTLVDGDYLFHYLSTQYQTLRAISGGDGGRGGLNLTTIKSFEIPLPELSIQRAIAASLDAFEDLVNDASKGIPAEIEARQKQYAFYRDHLLRMEQVAE